MTAAGEGVGDAGEESFRLLIAVNLPRKLLDRIELSEIGFVSSFLSPLGRGP